MKRKQVSSLPIEAGFGLKPRGPDWTPSTGPLLGIAQENVDTANTRSNAFGGAIDADGNEVKVKVATQGSTIQPFALAAGHAAAIMDRARAFGLQVPEGFLFESGQVFYDGNAQIEEVRIAGEVPFGKSIIPGLDVPEGMLLDKRVPWTATRSARGTTTDGPKLTLAEDFGLVLDAADVGRCHMSAVLIAPTFPLELPIGPEISLLWDLRANEQHADRLREAHRARVLGEQRPVLGEQRPVMRVPTPVALAFTSARTEALKASALFKRTNKTFPTIAGIQHWTVVPLRGCPLVLPFGEGFTDGVSIVETGREVRAVLSGSLLMTYLSTWALWYRDGCDRDGLFRAEPDAVADVRGFRAYEDARENRGKRYGKAMQDYRRDLGERLVTIGLSSTGEITAAAAEVLIQAYRRDGRKDMYRHAPLALLCIMRGGDFAQVPMAACRLAAHDAPAAYGLATFWRGTITRTVLRPGAPGRWQGPAKQLLQELGLFNENELRKGGRAYWGRSLGELARIMRDGGFGEAHVTATDPGPTSIVTLTPTLDLEEAYRPLLAARNAAAEREEEVARRTATVKQLGPRKDARRFKR